MSQRKVQYIPKQQQTTSTQNDTLVPPATVIKMKKNKGQIVPYDVYIGRRWTLGGYDLPQSKWANPFPVSKAGSVVKAVQLYREWIMTQPHLLNDIEELRGKVLACWCKNKPSDPCHGDVLVELLIANTNHSQPSSSSSST